MNIIVGDLCVSLVLFIYPKEIDTTNWCIFNCQIMLRIFISIIMFVCYVLVYHPKENINIHWPLSEWIICMTCILCLKTLMWILLYNTCFEFIGFLCIICANFNGLNFFDRNVPILMGLTSLTEMSKSNFTSVFWIMILLCWKRSMLLLLMLIAMKRNPL